MAAWSLHWKQYHQSTCLIFQQNMALYILLLLHMLIFTSFSQSYQEQLNLIPMAYCIVQLWHFIWTLLLQHLALICLNNYWDIENNLFFTSERHLLCHVNGNKRENTHKSKMEQNAKINVIFWQSSHKIADRC